ncbi:MAG: M28 family peptidase [Alphaproteobacteria bacterium]|nr:M28 family peptidase [Alphaproteobacteria bacterium]
MTPDEETVLSSITLEEPWSLVETFSTMHRWMPEDVNKGADEIIGRLQRLGIPHSVYEPDIYLSVPLSASVEIDGQSFRAKPPSMSLPVPDGVTGELVYLGANVKNLRNYTRDAADLFAEGAGNLAERLKGRILLTEGFGNPALTSIAEEAGALGLIVINPGQNIHWGTCTTIWGTPGLSDLARKPKIPVLAVNNPDGKALIEMAGSGQSVTMRSDLLEGWFTQKIPVVQIDGTEDPDRFVLVHGHYDSWEVGVGDNATGDATMLELARVLSDHRGKLRRSVRIAWWPGHSTGRYAGSTWYADAFAMDIENNCVASVNCDSPGCRWATSYHKTTCMSEMKAHVTSVIEEIAGQTPDWIRPKRAGDHSFYNIGLPTYFSLSSTMPDDLRAEKDYYEVSGCGGNIAWHTEDDTLEIADRDVLLTDIRIYTLAVLRHAALPVLPMDWRATAAEFADTIDTYRVAAGDGADLTAAHDATQRLAQILDKAYAAIDSGGLDPARANDLLVRISRVLVPVNFARQSRFMQDPAYVCPPLPMLAIAKDMSNLPADQIGFAKTELIRGQNQYVAALTQTRQMIEEALS